MAKSEVTFDGSELMSELRLSIRMPRAFGFRMWVVRQLLAVIGWVSPVTLDVDVVDAKQSEVAA